MVGRDVIRRDPLILALAGQAGAGKDTAADHLCRAHRFERYAFADPLRAMLEALFADAGLDYAYLFEPGLKELPVPRLGVSYRHLAQTLGTEWGRESVAPDLWLRLAALNLGLPDAPIHDRIVISDLRFANEADWVQQHGGVTVRIERSVAGVRPHASEAAAQQLGQHVIDNNGSPDALHEQLDQLLAQLGLH